ncbi:MAG: hypothetical protein HWD85_09385 [Flavobacteriaceae bacterium]|nr:hypothetical protein [Flavobacteriaceae bacterium]
MVTRTQIKIALTYLVIATFLGVFLRLFAILDVNATHRYIVHTHSHIALLGWVYVALTSLLFHIVVDNHKKKRYQSIFWFTQATIIGMLFTFPFVGYALYSIIFSTLFLVCSYWFFWFFKKNHTMNTKAYSYKFIYTSLVCMVVSSIGPWALGIIMNTLGSTSHWYKNAIYFYLHFQYNGWFLFCLFGLFFFILEKNKLYLPKKIMQLFFKLMFISIVFTLFLSFLWINPNTIIYVLAFVGGLTQLIAVFILLKMLVTHKTAIKNIFNSLIYSALKLVLLLFILKIALQFLSAFPVFVVILTELVDFVIGYLHLVFLGIVTITLLALLHYFKLLKLPKLWLLVFLTGFILSELLIFYKGVLLWQQQFLFEEYYLTLVLVSTLMLVGIVGVFITNLATNTPTPSTPA